MEENLLTRIEKLLERHLTCEVDESQAGKEALSLLREAYGALIEDGRLLNEGRSIVDQLEGEVIQARRTNYLLTAPHAGGLQ